MEIFLQFETWIALITLIFLEVVLGIDNIIFISIAADKLPEHQQAKARRVGLLLAMAIRVVLLMGVSYIIQMKDPIFTIDILEFVHDISIRDLILLAGGIFLLAKSTSEIHEKMNEHHGDGGEGEKKTHTLSKIIFQIVLLDIVFSFDSILTAIGLSDHLSIIVIAVIVSIVIMLAFSARISAFINKQPTLQILALSFLILISVMLILDAFHYEIPKGYIYFSVFFSLVVEVINMRMRKRRKRSA